jgi:hypothetical protein
MLILGLLMLIALGLLGVAASLRGRNPNLDGPLKQLESIEGWVGLIGLVWGLIMLLQWLMNLGSLAVVPLLMLIGLFSTLVILALSLILALPLLRKLIGANPTTNKLAEVSAKLAPFKAILGAICLALAIYTIIRLAI